MSTRSAIARCNKTFATTGGFKGVYHHWDGYPDGLGQTLFLAYKGETGTPDLDQFKGDLEGLLKYLIDEHPAGWSSIQANPCQAYPAEHRDVKITQKNASGSGCEWVYAFDVKKKQMYVLSSVNEDGSKMIGMFGFGNEDAEWKPVGCVDLEGDEPDWDEITYGSIETRLFRYYKETFTKDTELPQYIAQCPNGCAFYQSHGYKPGDKCDGEQYRATHYEREHQKPCGHIFSLPTLPGTNDVQTISGGAAALNK